MYNSALYFLTVMIWGTTWFAIKLQIGHAPDEISILYRSVLAALCLVAWCKFKKLDLRFSATDHLFLIGLGLSMFSLHYLFVFSATKYLASGIVSVIFSGISFLSILNNLIFFRTKPPVNVTLGALVGVAGLGIFFWNEIYQVNMQNDTLTGIKLAGIGTLIFSLGSSIAKRNHRKGLKIIPSMTIGMVYGTLAILTYCLVQSSYPTFPLSVEYWSALLYLVIFGSIVAFFCYLKLVNNVGPEVAGYSTVLFPIVALLISWYFESYNWSITHVLGLVFVIIGNVLVIKRWTIKANRRVNNGLINQGSEL